MSRGPAWTEREDALICEHFGRIPPAELLQMLPGRSRTALYDHCKKLRAAGVLQRVRRHDAQMQQAFSPATVDMHRGPAHLPGEPVITERTRIVRVGTPVDTRYAPERRVRIVDPDQCRPWAREAIR